MRTLLLRSFQLLLLLASINLATAMSVRPPEFSELVAKADVVIRSEVTAVRCEWRGTGETHRIVTLVTVAVRKCLVGDDVKTIELEFLGGKVGDDELTVAGQPQFKVGDTDILFVRGNGHQMCPLVNAIYGRYPVVSDAATATTTVTRNDGQPLASAADVAKPLADDESPAKTAATTPQRAAKSAPLTVDAFESEIVAQARALGRATP